VKVIQFADEKWLCNSQKIGVNPCKTSWTIAWNEV
jgi:hypothetical protein